MSAFFRAGCLLLMLLGLTACSTAQPGCYWPQSYASGCTEIPELAR